MRILPKQAGQVIHATRVRPLRSDRLHCVRDPLSRPIPVPIGLGNSIFRVAMNPPRVPSQRSP